MATCWGFLARDNDLTDRCLRFFGNFPNFFVKVFVVSPCQSETRTQRTLMVRLSNLLPYGHPGHKIYPYPSPMRQRRQSVGWDLAALEFPPDPDHQLSLSRARSCSVPHFIPRQERLIPCVCNIYSWRPRIIFSTHVNTLGKSERESII